MSFGESGKVPFFLIIKKTIYFQGWPFGQSFASLPRPSGTPSFGRGIGGDRYCSRISDAMAGRCQSIAYCLFPIP